MADKATSVNPAILRWARARTGLSIEDVGASLKKSSDLISQWEDGADFPTYVQLEELATKIYKRPVAIFFFPAPPEEPALTTEFRTLPSSELEVLDPATRYAIREARSYQESLRELVLASPDPFILNDIHAEPSQDPNDLASIVRDYLGIDVEQQRSIGSAENAFKRWRSALEDVGIFVFKGSVKQKVISGFCLYDREFPVIYVNNSTAFSRQSFTLFHELAHLLFATSGITTEHTDYLADLTGRSRRIEIACNQFAAGFLVPKEDFDRRTVAVTATEENISVLADEYNVSRETIARCFLDRGLLPQGEYSRLVDEWNDDYRRKGRGTGGNYYATKASYLGDGFLKIAFARFNEGKLSLGELAQHLGVKAKNVNRLQDFLVGRA